MHHKILNFLRRPKFFGDNDIKPLHHVLFWSVYFVFNTFRWSFIHDDFLLSFRTNLIGFPIHMFLAYLNAYYLMPKFIYTKKYVQYTAYILLALFIMLLFKYNLTYYLVSTDVMPEAPEAVNTLTIGYAIQTMIGEVYVISFFYGYKANYRLVT